MVFYKFKIYENNFLRYNTTAYYSIDFESYGQSGQLSFLHTLKNNWLSNKEFDLIDAKNEARDKVYNFLLDYDREYNITENMLVCRVPRSKIYFEDSQLYFQEAIKEAVTLANQNLNSRLIDGIEYITRIKDVATTHLSKNRQEGDIMPYPGITKDTCSISNEVRGRTILLIDDIYTLGVGVVEDCIQALYDKGARKVIFYAVGRTVKNRNTPAKAIGENTISDIELDDFKVPEKIPEIDIDDEIPF